MTLEEYLRREAAVFDEVHREDRAGAGGVGADARQPLQHRRASRAPRGSSRDYNRTFEVVPPAPRGGVLLVHGLSDSPYSMRALAERLGDEGYYALALRMPGHGAVPGGLTGADVAGLDGGRARRGARTVRPAPGPAARSSSSATRTAAPSPSKYALDAARRPGRAAARPPRPALADDRRHAVREAGQRPRACSRRFPYFDRAAWLDVLPEYNPFKFNSFPANAGRQTYDLTAALAAQLAAQRADGRLAADPADPDVPVARRRDRQHRGHGEDALRGAAARTAASSSSST